MRLLCITLGVIHRPIFPALWTRLPPLTFIGAVPIITPKEAGIIADAVFNNCLSLLSVMLSGVLCHELGMCYGLW